MSETQSLDLSALENDYDIVGELSGHGGARAFSATRKDAGTKRRDDQTGVLISVVTTPAGDEGNALSHLAADTKLLTGMSHRRLIPVIEGRWLGTEAFAVITQRTTDSSLAERIATGEKFSTPRIAAILREVNGVLQWAREHDIVHRNVTADGVYLEPKTDRVRVSFSVAPILRIQKVDAGTSEARTIVRLAMAMLTGSVDPDAYEQQCLADMRADLPERLCDATTALLDQTKAHTTDDVASYIALIGMADPLFLGEEEVERIRADILEEQRTEREKLAGERADFERLMAQEREQLAKEREDLQRAVASERAALVAKQAELERAVAEQRQELERAAVEDRRRIDALRAEIQRAGELELEKKRQAELDELSDAESTLSQAEFATPLFVPSVIAPLEQISFDGDSVLMRDADVVATPMRDEAASHDPSREKAMVTPPARVGTTSTRQRWIIPAALAVFLAIIGMSAIALGRRNVAVPPATTPVAKAVVAPAPVAVLPPPAVPLPSPGAIVDSSAGRVAASLATKSTLPIVKRKPQIVSDSATRPDSTVLRPLKTLSDSIFEFRSVVPVKRDTQVKRDSVRRDTTPD